MDQRKRQQYHEVRLLAVLDENADNRPYVISVITATTTSIVDCGRVLMTLHDQFHIHPGSVVQCRQGQRLLSMMSDAVQLTTAEPLNVRVIQTWTQAVDFLRSNPDRGAFCRGSEQNKCVVEVQDEDVLKQLRALPEQMPGTFLLVQDMSELDTDVACATLLGESPNSGGASLYMTELALTTRRGGGTDSPLYWSVQRALASQTTARTIFPNGLVQCIRDYAVDSLAEQCLDLLLKLSVRIFLGQRTWKLALF